jgi:hypothetical protein
MALGLTQPVTEMSTRNFPEGQGRPARKADNLTAICEPIVKKMWGPRRLTTRWASTACYRDSMTLPFTAPLSKRTECERTFRSRSLTTYTLAEFGHSPGFIFVPKVCTHVYVLTGLRYQTRNKLGIM